MTSGRRSDIWCLPPTPEGWIWKTHSKWTWNKLRNHLSDVGKRFSLQTTPESPTQKLLQVLHHISAGIAKEVATAQKAAMQYTSSHQQLQLLPGSSMNVNLVPKFFWPTRWRFSFWQTTKGKTTSSSFQILQTNRPWYSKATSQTSKNPFNKLSLTLCAAFAKSSAVCDYSVLCSFYCSYSLRLHQRSRPMVKRSTWSNHQAQQPGPSGKKRSPPPALCKGHWASKRWPPLSQHEDPSLGSPEL